MPAPLVLALMPFEADEDSPFVIAIMEDGQLVGYGFLDFTPTVERRVRTRGGLKWKTFVGLKVTLCSEIYASIHPFRGI